MNFAENNGLFTGNLLNMVIMKKIRLKVQTGIDVFENVNILASDMGITVYAVGGFVRDLYLGKEGTDIDFVVLGDALEFATRFKEKFRSGKVVTYPRFGTAMMEYRDYKLEFVSARSELYQSDSRKPEVSKADLDSDLSRRDFTINTLAMALSPRHMGEIIDKYGGIADIEQRLIRTPLDPELTFSDDPLRILRAIRFSAVLDFTIEEKTFSAISKTAERLGIISMERIRDEFNKTMMAERPSRGLDYMKACGLFPVIFPELESLSGVEQRQDFHHKDVFDHTLQVVDNVASASDRLELRYAALFHDIAKPQTKRFVENVGWTFHGHEDAGARMVNKIGRRMRMPVQMIKYIQKLVRLHLRPMQLVDESVTDSAIRRLMVEAGNEIDDLMILCRADITSKNPEKVRRYLQNFDKVEAHMKEVEEKDKLREFKLALTGDHIMDVLHIPAGPLVGRIKDAVQDAVLDGHISNNYEECLNYMMSIKNDYLVESDDKSE